MRDEIKAKIESKYLQQENETRSKCFQKIREMETIINEKYKINC